MARLAAVIALAALAACALRDERQPPMTPTESMLGSRPPKHANEVAWSEYPLVAACARAPVSPEVLDQPLTIVTDEVEYRRSFCRSSQVDWTRLRLIVYAESLAPRRVSLEGVMRDGADLLLVLRHASVCEVNTYEFQYETVAVLVPNGPETVRTFFAPGPVPPC